MTGSFSSIVLIILVIILPLIFAITLHEAAHGWVAKQFGDKTAYLMGRVTLNPVKHIDLFGTILLPLFMVIVSMIYTGYPFLFGWAKPVPVNWNNLKRPRLDKALVALAGPGANVVMAFFWAAVMKLCLMSMSADSGFALEAAKFFFQAGQFGVMINLVLCCLNLIPIPPLDGSRVISAILPQRMAYQYEKIEPYGIWILLGLIFVGALKYILFPIVSLGTSAIFNLFGLHGVL